MWSDLKLRITCLTLLGFEPAPSSLAVKCSHHYPTLALMSSSKEVLIPNLIGKTPIKGYRILLLVEVLTRVCQILVYPILLIIRVVITLAMAATQVTKEFLTPPIQIIKDYLQLLVLMDPIRGYLLKTNPPLLLMDPTKGFLKTNLSRDPTILTTLIPTPLTNILQFLEMPPRK
uniref:Uncharacterized protein n=1 Tax=Cacopsylla melanoneura TaxID=428564 RepID=A0A8D9DWA7_9HEMI